MNRAWGLWIPGAPIGHQRPVFRDGGYHQRGDRRDMCWRRYVRACWLADVGELALDEPVGLTLVFIGGRVDLDNLIKGIADALGARGWQDGPRDPLTGKRTGLRPLFGDDRCVMELDARKIASPGKGYPGVFVGAYALTGKDASAWTRTPQNGIRAAPSGASATRRSSRLRPS